MLQLNPTSAGPKSSSRPLTPTLDNVQITSEDLVALLARANLLASDATAQDILSVLSNQILSTLSGTLKTSSASLPLPTGAATEVTLQSLLKATQNSASSVWTDNSGSYYIQKQTVDAVTGVSTISYTDAKGNPATPGAGLRPSSSGNSDVSFESYWTAKATATGYITGQTLAQYSVYDTSTTPQTQIMSAWVNLSTGNTLRAAPPDSDIEPQSRTVVVSNVVEIFAKALPLPAGAATEAALQSILTALTAKKTYAATLSELAANSTVVIATGAKEISLANIGPGGTATVKTANMATAVSLYPAINGGLPISWRAPEDGLLPSVTLVTAANAVIQISVVR